VPSDWLLALADVAAIAAVALAGGAVAQRMRQPRIAGEMAAVFAAVSVLGGRIAGVAPGQQAAGAIAAVFPETAVALVSAVGAIGLALYMLLVGLTVDPAPMRERSGALVLLAAAPVGAALALAVAAGPLLAEAGWKVAGVGDRAFVLALAAALAANGMPIVARILEDLAMADSAVGSTVIVAATLATALALIAAAVAIAGADAAACARVGLRVGAALIVLAIVLAVARARRFALRRGVAVPAVVALALASAFAGDALLSSVLIGPLIVGIAVTKAGATALAVERRLGTAVRRVGLPAFLAVAALHADLGRLGWELFGPGVALLFAVIALKLGTAILIARTAGFGPADARAIGALMQCGGVMTIAVSLEILHARVIDPRMHATLTFIGLATTVAAGPLLPRAWRGSAPRGLAPGGLSPAARRRGAAAG
jgi:Kef-type K+ transport system membrane component KefB